MSKKKPPVVYEPDDEALAFVALLNQYRASRKLRKLTLNARLGMAARWHAQDMASNDFTSHTGSDGSEGNQRVSRAGYRWARWGECIQAGCVTAFCAIEALKTSPTHDAMMRKRRMHDVGVYRAYDDESYWTWYWVIDLGSKEL